MPTARRPTRVANRIAVAVTVQVLVAAAFVGATIAVKASLGSAPAIALLTLAFAAAGMFEMPLELRRHKFTFQLCEAVLAVGFFVVGPLGLVLAAGLGEAFDTLLQRMTTQKVLFNVAHRVSATAASALVFTTFAHADVQDAVAWFVALAAALVFGLVEVVSITTVLSIAEQSRFRHVFGPSVTGEILATLAAAPVGLVAYDLSSRGPLVPLLLVPLGIAVALNARYAVAQRDEHLRFERLFESSARTAGLHVFGEALATLASEARALTTGSVALCCATDVNGSWIGAFADEHGSALANRGAVATARELADRANGKEVDIADAGDLAGLGDGARSALTVTSVHEKAGRVVFVVLRDGTPSTDSAAQNRIDTLEAFANHAALIVANALMHEEREIALAREVDLNRQKSDFVAAVSHELRTPLAVMLGSVHTLERLDGRITDEKRGQLFDMTVDQGRRLQRLIDELLLVAAAEHSTVPLERACVDVQTVLANVAAATGPLSGNRLVCNTGDPIEVLTDETKLERILTNLVENAAKYAPDGPIELSASSDGVVARFSVCDHGPGIPDADRARVFERFVQLDQSSTRRQGGTGLGLHLCRQLAHALNGDIELGATPGGGCTFTVTIPVDAPASDETAETNTTSAVARSGSVRARPAQLDNPVRYEAAG